MPIYETARITERAATAYGRIHEAYDRQTDRFHELVAYPAFIRTLEPLARGFLGRRVLDLGCGSGRLMKALEAHGARCTGLDISSASVARARARGLDAREGSLHELPYEEESCDAIVSYHALNYVPRPLQQEALREIRRVLAPGGIIALACLAVPEEHPEELVLSAFGEEIVLYPASESELAADLATHGYQDVAVTTPEWPYAEYQALLARAETDEERAFIERLAQAPYARFFTAARA